MLNAVVLLVATGVGTAKAITNPHLNFAIDEKKPPSIWNDYRTYAGPLLGVAGAMVGGKAGGALFAAGLGVTASQVATETAKAGAQKLLDAEGGEAGYQAQLTEAQQAGLLPAPVFEGAPAYGYHQVNPQAYGYQPQPQAYGYQPQAFGCAPTPVQHFQPGPYTYAGAPIQYGAQQAPLPPPL